MSLNFFFEQIWNTCSTHNFYYPFHTLGAYKETFQIYIIVKNFYRTIKVNSSTERCDFTNLKKSYKKTES